MYELPKLPLPDGPFVPEWDSLARIGVPRWYQDAKFGIFIHWGVYSVPAFQDEWYPRKMYVKGDPAFDHHVQTWGPQNQFGYKDFIPKFTAPKFDAQEWVRHFKNAGARYVVPVAEHHDGFAMYATKMNKWNAANMGPKRDIIGLLCKAIRDAGLVFGVSNHRAEHWWYMNGGMDFDSDVKDPKYLDFYGPAKPTGETPSLEYKNDWLLRAEELIDLYRPDLVYFDTWVERPPLSPYLRHFGAYYYNRAAEWKQEVVINYKNHAFAPGTAVIDVERGQLNSIRPYFWQSDTSVGKKSWCHIADEEYKSGESIICDLADIVSKNGTLLLNIGPHADGSIPPEQQKILETIGAWLKTNGQAIYETRPWKVFGEGPTEIPDGHFTDKIDRIFTCEDFRFTTRGQNTLYAICLSRPGANVLVRSLGTSLKIDTKKIVKVELLGHDGPVQFQLQPDGLKVTIPPACANRFGICLKITRE